RTDSHRYWWHSSKPPGDQGELVGAGRLHDDRHVPPARLRSAPPTTVVTGGSDFGTVTTRGSYHFGIASNSRRLHTSAMFTAPPDHLSRPALTGSFGMAASTNWVASAVAQRVVERGGDAFDAVVAARFVRRVGGPQRKGAGGSH